jgi:hypothetical protein
VNSHLFSEGRILNRTENLLSEKDQQGGNKYLTKLYAYVIKLITIAIRYKILETRAQ